MLQGNKIYVGNLAYSLTEKELNEIFRDFGVIVEVCVIKEKETGRSKGYGFVRFETPKQAQDALRMNGMEFNGRHLVVNVARPKYQNRTHDPNLRTHYKDLGFLM